MITRRPCPASEASTAAAFPPHPIINSGYGAASPATRAGSGHNRGASHDHGNPGENSFSPAAIPATSASPRAWLSSPPRFSEISQQERGFMAPG